MGLFQCHVHNRTCQLIVTGLIFEKHWHKINPDRCVLSQRRRNSNFVISYLLVCTPSDDADVPSRIPVCILEKDITMSLYLRQADPE
jgi:hypothetical protein